MEASEAKRLIEGLLFVSGGPVALTRLTDAVGDPAAGGAGLNHQTIRQFITQLNDEYVQSGRAFRIQEIAGGYHLVTDPSLSPWIKRLLQLPREDTLSKPALETLAIIAYRQPITKAEIEAIRGVDGSATLETLLEHRFVRVVGRKDTPGRPLLYGTTEEFLRHFGLKTLKDLPPMSQDAGTIPSFEPMTPQPSAVSQPVAEPAVQVAAQHAEGPAAP